jgi:serine/threonine protein kinase
MRLPDGARLAQYQIVGRLGAGGMGEVYRARDTKLNRDVAIKILLPGVANDPDHLARFTREAHVLAALNHPYIAHIYGLEDDDGLHALIMEVVEGPTLADRLANGPLPLEEALSVARQIAEALASAHGQGVVHRDLKPSNIKLRSDGTVKILDFGLAKALEPPGSLPADAAGAPTITSTAFTRLGVILGTAAYMSPEQARGQAVDKRTDIWAFGCVLFEMLTGRRAFPGETISDTIAAVLDKAPEWERLPPATPSSIRRLLERTIEKRANRRLHDIADALLELDDAMSRKDAPAPSGASALQSMRWRVAAIALAGATALFAYLALSQSGRLTSSDRFLPFASERLQQLSPAWSPDGRSVAYVATVDEVRELFVKSVDADVPTRLTQSGSDCRSPVWSPDGARIYYVSKQQLWSVGAAGGQPQLMLEDVSTAAVAADGTIAFLRGVGGKQTLWIAPASGARAPYRGAPFPEAFTRSNSIGFSRDGSKIAVLVEHQSGAALTFELWIIPYPEGTPRRALGPFQSPTSPFDMGRISWMPDNRHVILQNTPPDEQNWHLHSIDTDTGASQILTSGTSAEWTPAVSPDGRRIAFASGVPDFDIVQVSIDSGEMRPVLSTGRNETSPTWSPTGTRFAYLTNVRGRSEVWLHSTQDDSSVPILNRSAGVVHAAADDVFARWFEDRLRRDSVGSTRHLGVAGRRWSAGADRSRQRRPAWGGVVPGQQLHRVSTSARWSVGAGQSSPRWRPDRSDRRRRPGGRCDCVVADGRLAGIHSARRPPSRVAGWICGQDTAHAAPHGVHVLARRNAVVLVATRKTTRLGTRVDRRPDR